MTLFKTRASILASVIAVTGVATATITGCSAGQQASTALQEPAVNGNRAAVGDISLLDVRIRAEQTGDAVPAGETVELLFVAANQSAEHDDRLVKITSDVGDVRISGDRDVPALNSLIVGIPDGSITSPLEDALDTKKAQARISLDEPISNGLNYGFTFTFEKAGETTFAVPVSAGMDSKRVHKGTPHGGGH